MEGTNFMGKLKDKMYNYFVRKNGRVWYEYERYVREHMEEHRLHRFNHIRLLMKLNWFYRVKKGNTPYIYWDEPLNKVIINNEVKSQTQNNRFHPESLYYQRETVDKLVTKLLNYDVICFDVFDTLIFRVFSSPDDAFKIMGIKQSIPDYKVIRKRALLYARKHQEKDEVSLSEIYNEIRKFYGTNIDEEMEIEIEKEITYANSYMLDVVNKLTNKGKTIVAVSDMYLSGKTITEILINAGFPPIDVYSSSDVGLNKKDGRLQAFVKEKMGAEKSYIFVGDNYTSDFQGSLKAGLNAYWYKNCQEIGSPYRSKADTSIAASVYKAIVNNTLHNGLFREGLFYEHGYTYAGYIVCGFCKWINELAKRYQIDKFLFLSRDMDVFYKAYNKFFYKLENEYVVYSRFAIQQLVFDIMPGEYIENTIKTRIEKNSIKEALAIFDLPDFKKELLEVGLDEENKLTNENYEKIIEIIYNNKDKVIDQFKGAVCGAKEYYRKLIGDSKNICILDLGWKGTAVVYLKKLFEVWGFNVNVRGAIVSISGNSYAESVVDSGLLDTYMKRQDIDFKVGVPRNANFEAFRGHLFEATFTSTKSSLLEYTDTDTFIYSRENPNAQLVEEIQRGIMDFCFEYIKRTKCIDEIVKITGFNANTPINKVLKDKSYTVQIWGDVLDEASGEPGFSKEAKTKTFFNIMEKAKLADARDYMGVYGCTIESDCLFICSTYSQVFITLVKIFNELIDNVDLILYDDIPNCYKLRNNLRRIKVFNNIIIFTKEGLPQRFHMEETDVEKLLEYHKFHMLSVEQKLRLKIENYKDVYLYYDGHHLGLYIQEKHIKYHLIEDGMNHFQHIYATPSVQEIPIVSEDNLKAYRQGWKYMCCGQNPDCISLEVNENRNLAIYHPNIIEKPRAEMIKNLSKDKKKLIYQVFIEDLNELKRLKNSMAIVFTSVLFNDGWVDSGSTQIKIYREIVDDLEKEGYFVVIKPHPRDKLIYSKHFQDCYIIDRLFPSEILDFDDSIQFEKGVVIASSAMELLNCIEKKERLGFKYFEKYREQVAPWLIESLDHPERHNW